MKISHFPECCAMELATNFGNTFHAHDQTNYSTDQVNEFFKTYLGYSNVIMAVINSDQHKKLYRTFLKNGFRQKAKFYSPNHLTNVYVMMYIPEKRKPRTL